MNYALVETHSPRERVVQFPEPIRNLVGVIGEDLESGFIAIGEDRVMRRWTLEGHVAKALEVLPDAPGLRCAWSEEGQLLGLTRDLESLAIVDLRSGEAIAGCSLGAPLRLGRIAAIDVSSRRIGTVATQGGGKEIEIHWHIWNWGTGEEKTGTNRYDARPLYKLKFPKE